MQDFPLAMEDFRRNILLPLQKKFRIVLDEKNTDFDERIVTLRSDLNSMNKIEKFILHFKHLTRTVWKLYCKAGKRIRFAFLSKSYYCMHKGCDAKIDIDVKKCDVASQHIDPYLRKGYRLPCVIVMSLNHSHDEEGNQILCNTSSSENADQVTKVADKVTEVADKVTEVADKATEVADVVMEIADEVTEAVDEFMKAANDGVEVADAVVEIADEVKEQCQSYFEMGLDASAAEIFHKMRLLARDSDYQAVDGVMGTLRHKIQYLHTTWLEENPEVSNDIKVQTDLIRSKLPSYEENGTTIEINDEAPWCIMVVTPIMKKFQSFFEASETIFIETTSNFKNSSCCGLTTMFAGWATGALPIVYFFHERLDKSSYRKCFSCFKTAFPEAFGDKKAPAAFMTEDSVEVKSALKEVWPTSDQFLYQLYLLQDQLKWLNSSAKAMPKEDKKTAMRFLQAVVYAQAIKTSKKYEKLIKHDPRFKAFRNHFINLLARSEEWHTFNMAYMGHNKNQPAETSARILKDLVYGQAKNFTLAALVEFCIVVLQEYLSSSSHLIDSEDDRSELLYARMVEKFDINKNDVICEKGYFYRVPKEADANGMYEVNISLGICSCPYGSMGKLCKHQFFLLMNFDLRKFNLNAFSICHYKEPVSDSSMDSDSSDSEIKDDLKFGSDSDNESVRDFGDVEFAGSKEKAELKKKLAQLVKGDIPASLVEILTNQLEVVCDMNTNLTILKRFSKDLATQGY